MTWLLKSANNYHQTHEHCLQLIHIKRNQCLRQWFGPMAQQLYSQYTDNISAQPSQNDKQAIVFNKQDAQSFLVNASFFHHQCFHQYQIMQDISQKNLQPFPELCELLLYIRMTSHHPNLRQLEFLVDCHLDLGVDFSRALKTLVEAQLIQKIEFSDLQFYDKNPFPHDHIFDPNNLTLKDRGFIDTIDAQHKLISQPINNLSI